MIIEQLFRGQIYPLNNAAPFQDEGYDKSVTRVSELLTMLEKKLNADDNTLLKELHSEMMSIQLKESEAYFRYGLSLGIQLIYEVMSTLNGNR